MLTPETQGLIVRAAITAPCTLPNIRVHFHAFAKVAVPVQEWPMEAGASLEIPNNGIPNAAWKSLRLYHSSTHRLDRLASLVWVRHRIALTGAPGAKKLG